VKRVAILLLVLAGCEKPAPERAPERPLEPVSPFEMPSSAATAQITAFTPPRPAPSAAPIRIACTDSFGRSLSKGFGRLDGTLVSIVRPGERRCRGDAKHLHLQVKAKEEVYDVAINVGDKTRPDVFFTTSQQTMTHGPWREGWHTGLELDYASTLRLHAETFHKTKPDDLARDVESMLSGVDKITIYGTAYGTTGIHDVHRARAGHDGAIVFPGDKDTPARFLVFRFARHRF
jgi:hypothetical protein